jgi:hypothetical protein
MYRDQQKALVFLRIGGRRTECACYELNGIVVNPKQQQGRCSTAGTYNLKMVIQESNRVLEN